MLLFSLALFSGCSYLSNRGKDLGDILSVGGSLGGGLMLRVAPTRLLTVELGSQKDERFYGWGRRHSQWVESSYGFWLSKWWSARLDEEAPQEWTWTHLFRSSHEKLALLEDTSEPLKDAIREEWEYHMFILTNAGNAHWHELMDVEVDASLLAIGGQIIVRPLELVDFLAGLFLLDLSGDDEG
jgi:hypothetical protein